MRPTPFGSVSASRDAQPSAPASEYLDVRRRSEALCAALATEDYVIQAVPEASPQKWHLAHVSGFFDVFLLMQYVPDAYETWAGKRSPSEAESETVTRGLAVAGNPCDQGYLQPGVATGEDGLLQRYGDDREHTPSAYQGYPGFRPAAGGPRKDNGKFVSWRVLRGGSCATASTRVRASYRNFFCPQERSQFLGVRLAEDA